MSYASDPTETRGARHLPEFAGPAAELPTEPRRTPLTPRRAMEVIRQGGTLSHKWFPPVYDSERDELTGEDDLVLMQRHDPSCEWCQAVELLNRIVENRERELAQQQLERSW